VSRLCEPRCLCGELFFAPPHLLRKHFEFRYLRNNVANQDV
jgi:hypothetical protein